MNTLYQIDLDGSLENLKDLFLLIATELGPQQALAALAVEKKEVAELIASTLQMRPDAEDKEMIAEIAETLRERQELLDSITEAVTFADCTDLDEAARHSGPWLCWNNPAKMRRRQHE